MAQILVPSSTYQTLTTAGIPALTVDTAGAYAAYANQAHLQYALLGNQMLNYAPVYAQTLAPTASQCVDQKHVQNVISGNNSSENSYASPQSQPQQQSQQQQQQQQQQHQPQQQVQHSNSQSSIPSYHPSGYPYAHPSLSQIYAASTGLPNDLMYYGGRAMYNHQQTSSLSSSVDSAYHPAGSESVPGSDIYNSKGNAGSNSDLAHTLSSMSLNNGHDGYNHAEVSPSEHPQQHHQQVYHVCFIIKCSKNVLISIIF